MTSINGFWEDGDLLLASRFNQMLMQVSVGLSSRPAATSDNRGMRWYDSRTGLLYRSTGSTWEDFLITAALSTRQIVRGSAGTGVTDITLRAPVHATVMVVRAVAAGGGGRRGSTRNGGGGGQYAEGIWSVSPGESVSVVVGGAGRGETATQTVTDGGLVSVSAAGVKLVAEGGKGNTGLGGSFEKVGIYIGGTTSSKKMGVRGGGAGGTRSSGGGKSIFGGGGGGGATGAGGSSRVGDSYSANSSGGGNPIQLTGLIGGYGGDGGDPTGENGYDYGGGGGVGTTAGGRGGRGFVEIVFL